MSVESLLPGQRADAPVKGTKSLSDLTSAWRYIPTADFDQASAKGTPAGFVLDYAVAVEGDGAVYVAEGDVTALDPAPVGMKVTQGAPLNCTAHGAGVRGISIRSVPDSAVARLIIGASTWA